MGLLDIVGKLLKKSETSKPISQIENAVSQISNPSSERHIHEYQETGSFFEGIAKSVGFVGWRRGESMEEDKTATSGWSTGPNRNLQYNAERLAVQGINLEDLVAVRVINRDYDNIENGNMYAFARPTIHFTLNHYVQEHSLGSWEGGNVCYIISFKKLLELNRDRFYGGTGVDIFFVGYVEMPSPRDFYLVRRYSGESFQSFRERINMAIERTGHPVVKGGELYWNNVSDMHKHYSFDYMPSNDSEMEDVVKKYKIWSNYKMDWKDISDILFFRLGYLIKKEGCDFQPHFKTLFKKVEDDTASFLYGTYDVSNLKKELEEKYGYNIEEEREIGKTYVKSYAEGKAFEINIHYAVLFLRIFEILFDKNIKEGYDYYSMPDSSKIPSFRKAIRKLIEYWENKERLDVTKKKEVLGQITSLSYGMTALLADFWGIPRKSVSRYVPSVVIFNQETHPKLKDVPDLKKVDQMGYYPVDNIIYVNESFLANYDVNSVKVRDSLEPVIAEEVCHFLHQYISRVLGVEFSTEASEFFAMISRLYVAERMNNAKFLGEYKSLLQEAANFSAQLKSYEDSVADVRKVAEATPDILENLERMFQDLEEQTGRKLHMMESVQKADVKHQYYNHAYVCYYEILRMDPQQRFGLIRMPAKEVIKFVIEYQLEKMYGIKRALDSSENKDEIFKKIMEDDERTVQQMVKENQEIMKNDEKEIENIENIEEGDEEQIEENQEEIENEEDDAEEES
jgi:hypothetical protein